MALRGGAVLPVGQAVPDPRCLYLIWVQAEGAAGEEGKRVGSRTPGQATAREPTGRERADSFVGRPGPHFRANSDTCSLTHYMSCSKDSRPGREPPTTPPPPSWGQRGRLSRVPHGEGEAAQL